MNIDIKNIKIIPAKIEDCRKLSYLKREIWETTYRGLYPDEKLDNYDYEENTKKFENIIKSSDFHLYVVKYKSEIIGYMDFGKPLRPFRNYTQEIGLLYVRKDFQKLGIGKKLFNLAYSHIQSTGVDNFFISCHKYNINARKFYEKMGGKLVYIDEDKENAAIPQVKYEYTIK